RASCIHAPPPAPPLPYTTLFRSAMLNSTPPGGSHLVLLYLPLTYLAAHTGLLRREYLAVHQLSRSARFHVNRVRHREQHIHIGRDRKSTRLNSSHSQISYAVFCL